MNAATFGKKIKKYCDGIQILKKGSSSKRNRVRHFPDLEECRKQFEAKFNVVGSKIWDEEEKTPEELFFRPES